MVLPKFTRTKVRRDPTQETIQRLIIIWEKRVRPDAIKLINSMVDEPQRKVMEGFYNALEARVMAQIVLDVCGEPVDKKPVVTMTRIPN